MRKRINLLDNAIDKLLNFKAHVLIFEVLIGFFLNLVSFILFIKLRGETFEKELTAFDNTIWHFFYALRSTPLTKIMIAFSNLGGELSVVILIILSILFFVKHYHREAFLLTFLFAMSTLLDSFLKQITQRPRPYIAPLVAETSFSFPSGHAMNSLVFYMAIAYFTYQILRKKKLSILILIGFGALIFMIGTSRVYLGVHYATDVVAGYIIGFWWLLTVIVLEKTLILFKLYSQSSHSSPTKKR
ncbi:MAG: phosphatase PAP2 family protein [Candidatus Woesebacteria bacterium]|nr:MAG: phosphatase PAP2 family protein [Candidatus Woesebacteria bacterium]